MQKNQLLFELIEKEQERQKNGIELIASENFASPQIIETINTVLTNKYTEKLPGKRYYKNCEVVDEIEQLAIDKTKKLFKTSWVNVQPHSGAQANATIMLTMLKPDDKILGFDLSHSGHLTHNSHVNFSNKLYNPSFYKIDPQSNTID